MFLSWLCCKPDISKAMAVLINHQDEGYMKRLIIRILRHYASTTDNTLDDEMVDIIELHLLDAYHSPFFPSRT